MAEKPTYEDLLKQVRNLEIALARKEADVNRDREIQQNYKAMFEHSQVFISVYDPDGICLLMNHKTAELFGGKPNDFIGKAFTVLHPDKGEEYFRRIRKAVDSGQVATYEDLIAFPQGERWFLSTVQPLSDDGGRYMAAQIVSVDISHRKKAEERLRFFKTALDHSSDAIGLSTSNGIHWYQNKAFEVLFGDIGKDPPSTVYMDEKKGREIFSIIQNGGQWIGEIKMRGADSRILDIFLRAFAITDDNGNIIGLAGAHTDITKQKKEEKSLRESEERLRAIFEANPNPMVIYDMKGNPLYLNPAFTRVFGWTLKEVRGRPIDFVPEQEKQITRAKITELYEHKKPVRFETRRLTKAGEQVEISISAAVVRQADGDPMGMVVNLTDMTERKTLEAKYEQAQRMEALGTLAGGIAHDFNNILMGVQGRISLMRLDLAPDHPHFEHLNAMETYIQNATHLTRQLLGFARGGKYEVKAINMNELAQTSVAMFGRTRKEIRVHTRFQEELSTVEADRRQLEQVLLNIYVNAWQAMPKGGSLTITTTQVILDEDFCKPHKVRPGIFVRLSITDTGEGMDQAVLSRIFDPFFTTKEKARGTGLGLATAYGIIKNHGGIITVYSEKKRGATFNIYLPASGKRAEVDRPELSSLLKGTETVLLVDDEDIIIEVAAAMLKTLGYRVVVASSGKMALQALTDNESKIDLMILDVIMPEMEGGEVLERVRDIRPDLPVILSSGYPAGAQIDAVMKKGSKGFIQKPFSINELSVKIRSVLDEEAGDG